jgi:hypothetical protein
MYFSIEVHPIQVYTKPMTTSKSTPEKPGLNIQAEDVAADYRDGLRILAHLIAKKHWQTEHSRLNVPVHKGEAHDRNENKS